MDMGSGLMGYGVKMCKDERDEGIKGKLSRMGEERDSFLHVRKIKIR